MELYLLSKTLHTPILTSLIHDLQIIRKPISHCFIFTGRVLWICCLQESYQCSLAIYIKCFHVTEINYINYMLNCPPPSLPFSLSHTCFWSHWQHPVLCKRHFNNLSNGKIFCYSLRKENVLGTSLWHNRSETEKAEGGKTYSSWSHRRVTFYFIYT